MNKFLTMGVAAAGVILAVNYLPMLQGVAGGKGA